MSLQARLSSQLSPTPSRTPCLFKIYINGKLYDKEDAKISVYDHGLLYGDGVFEGIRSYGGKVFRLAEHLDRLWNSAKAIWLEIPMTQAEMAKAIDDTLAANGIKDGYIRLVVTRGAGTLGLDPNRCSNPQVIIITDTISLYPEELYREGAGDRHRQHAAQPSGRAQPADQVAQLPEQHPGQDRGPAGRLHRGPDAQPQGRSGRVHRRQHLPGPRRRAAHAADRRRHPRRHHPRRRDRPGPRGGHRSPRDRR